MYYVITRTIGKQCQCLDLENAQGRTFTRASAVMAHVNVAPAHNSSPTNGRVIGQSNSARWMNPLAAAASQSAPRGEKINGTKKSAREKAIFGRILGIVVGTVGDIVAEKKGRRKGHAPAPHRLSSCLSTVCARVARGTSSAQSVLAKTHAAFARGTRGERRDDTPIAKIRVACVAQNQVLRRRGTAAREARDDATARARDTRHARFQMFWVRERDARRT